MIHIGHEKVSNYTLWVNLTSFCHAYPSEWYNRVRKLLKVMVHGHSFVNCQTFCKFDRSLLWGQSINVGVHNVNESHGMWWLEWLLLTTLTGQQVIDTHAEHWQVDRWARSPKNYSRFQKQCVRVTFHIQVPMNLLCKFRAVLSLNSISLHESRPQCRLQRPLGTLTTRRRQRGQTVCLHCDETLHSSHWISRHGNRVLESIHAFCHA